MAAASWRRRVGIAALVLLTVPVALVVLSEMGEVAVVRSDVEGSVRETRIWVVDDGGALLVRGSQGKGWLADAVRAGEVELDRAGASRRYRVVERPGAEALDLVNARMREKYGFADVAIGWMRDYASAVPLRLEPVER